MTTTATPRPPAPDANQAWTRDDVAAYLQVSATSVDVLRAADSSFPEPIAILSLIRWRPTEVIAWFNGADLSSSSQSAQTAQTTRSAAPVAVPVAPRFREGARRG